MRNWLIRCQLKHLAELRDGRCVIALLLVIDAQIEPGVGKRWVVLLYGFADGG